MKNKTKNEPQTVNVEAVINAWFLKTVHETIIQQDVVLYNKFYTAKDELINLLKGEQQPTEETI